MRGVAWKCRAPATMVAPAAPVATPGRRPARTLRFRLLAASDADETYRVCGLLDACAINEDDEDDDEDDEDDETVIVTREEAKRGRGRVLESMHSVRTVCRDAYVVRVAAEVEGEQREEALDAVRRAERNMAHR